MGFKLSEYTDRFKNFFRTSNGYYHKQSTMIGQKGAVWLDTSNKRLIFESIPQVKTVVERKSAMFSNMKIVQVDSATKEVIENPQLDKLLLNPNVMQSQNEWLSQYKKQESVYGNQFMYKNQGTLEDLPKSLINISPLNMIPHLTGKFFDQVEVAGIISKFEFKQGDHTMKTFDSKDIMWTRITDLDSILEGTSPIDALKFPISNIKGAYEYRNVILTEKGAIGILSNETKDALGGMPLKKDEKKKLEDEYLNQYGVGQDQRRVILTEASLKWQPMTYPTKDLLLFEEIDENFMTIIDAYGLNANIFSTKNATFENVKQSLIAVYENTIQPEADLFVQKLGDFMNIAEGTELVAKYDHLNVLKEDQELNANVMTSKIASITQLVDKAIITPAQALKMVEDLVGIKLTDLN